jgi:mono/diheme cytochrome c family protein
MRTALAVVIVASSVGALAQSPAPPPAAAPVFTTQQATAGKAAFGKTCAMCHMPDLSGNNEVPQLAGMNFRSTWRARTTKDLLEYMTAAMPPGGPPQTADTYASIAAYILQSNGAVAGPDALGASTAVTIRDLVPGAP